MRRLFLLLTIIFLGFLISQNTSGEPKKKASGNCGYNKGKYYCCYPTGSGAICYPETPPPPANP